MYTVYMHTNMINLKKYVGITCQQPWTKRFNNGTAYKNCIHFDRAIKFYGWDNFKHEILEICETEKEAMRLEKHYISIYKTNNKEHGYNIKEGGEHQEYPKELCKRISDAKKGMIGPMTGKHHTEETKQKIRNAQIGRPLTQEHAENCRRATREYYKTHSPAHTFTEKDHENAKLACQKKVCIIETGQVFESMTECANYLGVLISNLSRAIKLNRRYKGFHYKIVCS